VKSFGFRRANKFKNQNAKFKNKLFYDEFNILNFNIVILIFSAKNIGGSANFCGGDF